MESGMLSAVFDLDGTLLDGDSTSIWMIKRIKKSAWRTIFAAAAFPFALPLTLYAPSRRIGGSIFLWIASFGMNEVELRKSFAMFANDVSAGRGVAWRPNGVAELKKHVVGRNTALIATAAPAWLAESLSETLPFCVPVVGSSVSQILGGWVARYHCRHQAKCDAISHAGYGKHWAAAYSDSVDDGPLLAHARTAFLVNASHQTAERLARSGIRVEQVVW